MEQVTLSTTESTFLAPSGFLQSASLLGQSGSGFSLMELSSCLTLLVCSSGSFLLPLSVAFPNRLPVAAFQRWNGFHRSSSGTIRQSDHSPCFTPRFALDLSDRLCPAV